MFKNQGDMKIDGWRIYDLPIKYTETDYDEARVEIVNKIKKIPGLIALFEYGSTSALGISDMDFWVVFSDDAPRVYIPDEPILSAKTRYLMMHRMILVSEKHYRKVLYFDPWTTIPWPSGHRFLWKREDVKRDLNFEKINFTQEERNIVSALFLETCIGIIYSSIPFYANKEIPVRDLLETMNNCIYIVREVNILTGKNRQISCAFSEDIVDLRKNWFNLDQKEAGRRLIKILYEGLLVSFEASFALSDWLREQYQLVLARDLGIGRKKHYLGQSSKDIYLNSPGNRRVFTDFVKTPEQALKLSLDSYKKIKINFGRRTKITDFYVIFQPFEMASMPLGFISQDSLLSRNLRKDIFTNQERVPILNSKTFFERVKMINEMTEIYDKKKVPNSDGKIFQAEARWFGYEFGREDLKRKLFNFYLKHKFWRTVNKKSI